MHKIMQEFTRISTQNCAISRIKGMVKSLVLSMFGWCLVVAFAAGNCLFAADDPIDGTLVWVGPASGGNWSDEKNWQVKEGDTGTVADLLTKRTIYDFSKLANGAVVINNWKGGNVNAPADTLLIRGIICSGAEGDTWTITAGSNSPNQLRFSNPCEANINGGTLVINHSFSDKGTPYQTLRKTGSGKIKLMKSIKFWESTPSIDLQSGTVELANGFDAGNTMVKMYNGATLLIASGTVKLGHIYSADVNTADSTSVLKVESGATLLLDAGYSSSGELKFGGNIEGGGVIKLYGSLVYCFNAGSKTSALPFSGRLELRNADVVFGTETASQQINSAASLDIETSGLAVFHGDQELSGLSGEGATGGVVLNNDAKLTVNSTDTHSVYKARITGSGSLCKDGAGSELVMAGVSDYSGATTVKSGSLTVDTYYESQDIGVYYDFNDSSNVGRDVSKGGKVNLVPQENPKYTSVTDGVSGRALHLDKTKANEDSVLRFVDQANGQTQIPSGNNSFTVSLWLRPSKDSGLYSNILAFGAITGNEVTDYWNTFILAPAMFPDGDSRPNGAFNRLVVYPCVGWSARGQNAAVAELYDRNYSLTDGRWHHIAFTYNSSTFETVIYVDGIAMGSTKRGSNIWLPENPGVKIFTYSGDKNHIYTGDIDEVKILPTLWSAEQIAAEYASGGTRNEVQVPTPVSEWSFNEDSGDGSYVSSGSCPLKLVSVTQNGTPGLVIGRNEIIAKDCRVVKCVQNEGTLNADKSVADYVALRLDEGEGEKLATAIPAGRSFTISARTGRAVNGVFLTIGDGSSAGSVRLRHLNETPRRIAWNIGSDSDGRYDDAYLNTTSMLGSNWLLSTVTYDAETKTIKYYEDGVLVRTETRELAGMNFSDIVFGATRDAATGELSGHCFSRWGFDQLDDLAIFDCALTKEQVKKHARSVIGIAADATVLPTVSPVTVEDNATLRVLNGNEKFKSLSGAGDVEISRGSSLTLNGIDKFTGRILGPGDLFLGGKVQLTSTVAVENPITITSITTDKNGTTLPMVDGRDKISVASSGVFTLENDRQIVSKMYPIARNVKEYVLPEDASGWKLVPESKLARFSFVVRDGVLYARVAGKSLTICVR